MIADIRHSQYSDNYVSTDGIYSATSTGKIVVEEAVVLGRNKYSIEDSGGTLASVNGPEDNKGQNFWDGTYTVRLKRQGLIIERVYSLDSIGRGSQNQYVYSPYEEVSVTWINRDNVQIPVIISGSTLDSFNKSLSGKSHLLDYGERILRSAIANSPGKINNPFAYNQFDNPNSQPLQSGEYDENSDSVVKNPGGELFLDKFGRVLSLGRQNNSEFMTTYGKIDSGQDDVSSLTTPSEQDSYYDKIESDESKPLSDDLSEPLAPKSLNLVQYQQIQKKGRLTGDNPDSGFGFGVLPRFDKWKFIPVIIRSYDGGDGSETQTQSVFNERSSLYSRTVTDNGDIKIYSPGNYNSRVVGDVLESIGGNVETKIKTRDRLSDGSTNPSNIYHSEYLTDGTIRIRSNENSSSGTSNYFNEVDSSGSILIYSKSGGGTSSDYSFKITGDSSSGDLDVDTKGNIKLSAGTSIEYVATTTYDVSAGEAITIQGQANAEMITNNGTVIGSAGSTASAEAFVKGVTLKNYLDSLVGILNGWVFVPADGGASLKAAITTWVASVHTAISGGNLYLSQQNSANANKVN